MVALEVTVELTLELVDEDTMIVTGEVLEAVVADVVDVEFDPPLYVGGTTGSRWKIPVSGLTPVLGCAPTAQPSVGLVV